jgi:cytochrome P450
LNGCREDLNRVPFLTKCIKESLRMTPPVPFIGRELDAPLEIEGVTLLPGTFVDINIWAVHHNEYVWGKDHMVEQSHNN